MDSELEKIIATAGMSFADYSESMTLRSNFADNLVRLRKDRGLTQDDIAERTGMAVQTIRGYEQRINWPDPERIELLAKALDVTVCDLMRDQATGPSRTVSLERMVRIQEHVAKLITELGYAELLPSVDKKATKRAFKPALQGTAKVRNSK